MARSNFSPKGLPIGENNINMTYLYGLSDFFSVMFENPETIDLLLESQSVAASNIYSKFLQATSTVSLEDIQKTLGQTLELVTIKSTDAVSGEVNLYNLPNNVVSSRYIANRPLLPTSLLEQGVDYRLEQTIDGKFRVRFAKDISSVGFSTRLLPDETTKEYALWFVDAELDEGWISSYYGDLIGISPESSTETFKNFISGLYYIYTNGPTLDLIRKGLNLVLGVPLARDIETVIEIRKYLETDQYIVITDLNQYILPLGLPSSVAVGDVLAVADELAQWVEVKDYINDGDWWINLMIPPSIIPVIPDGQVDRYATSGSHYDYLMRNYLKTHSFLVKVNVGDFKDTQIFQQLSDVIYKAKPTYTRAIYIWAVSHTETLTVSEGELKQRWDQFRCENVTMPIDKFYRNNTDDPLKRGCPTFIRFNVPYSVTKLCGTNTYVNGLPFQFQNVIVDGFINPVHQYRVNTDVERAWIRSINERGSETWTRARSKLGFSRGIHSDDDSDFDYAGVPVHISSVTTKIPVGMKVIPLYITTQEDIKNKCNSVGIRVPDLIEWRFDILNPLVISNSINSLPINEGVVAIDNTLLTDNFSTLFFRDPSVGYLSNLIPNEGYKTWAPNDSSFINQSTDYLLGVRIHSKVVGVYWVTVNSDLPPNMYLPVEEIDSLNISMTARTARGLGPTSSPYYTLRGRDILSYNIVTSEINALTINDGSNLEDNTFSSIYSDTENPDTLVMTRDGQELRHIMEIK